MPAAQQNVSGYQELTVNMSPDESVVGSTDLTLAVSDNEGHTWSSLVSTLNKWAVTRMPGSTSSDLGPNGKLVLQQVHVPTATRAGAGLDLSHIFADIPGGAATYIPANVLHDWDDSRAVQILRTCCRIMVTGGRVLIVERLIPDDPADALPVLLSDMTMLVFTGGQERTNAEYAQLLADAGLIPGKILAVATPYGVIEGIAPWRIIGLPGTYLREWFSRLSKGGRVVDDLQARSWGASDGQVVDRFGSTGSSGSRIVIPAEDVERSQRSNPCS